MEASRTMAAGGALKEYAGGSIAEEGATGGFCRGIARSNSEFEFEPTANSSGVWSIARAQKFK